jgi:hypothetical protein
MCDQHFIRASSPPSRCDWCEAEFRDSVNSGRQVGITAAFAGGPVVGGVVLLVTGHPVGGAAAFMLGPLVGIAVRAYQRGRSAMRRRFLAERADPVPEARVVRRGETH